MGIYTMGIGSGLALTVLSGPISIAIDGFEDNDVGIFEGRVLGRLALHPRFRSKVLGISVG